MSKPSPVNILNAFRERIVGEFPSDKVEVQKFFSTDPSRYKPLSGAEFVMLVVYSGARATGNNRQVGLASNRGFTVSVLIAHDSLNAKTDLDDGLVVLEQVIETFENWRPFHEHPEGHTLRFKYQDDGLLGEGANGLLWYVVHFVTSNLYAP